MSANAWGGVAGKAATAGQSAAPSNQYDRAYYEARYERIHTTEGQMRMALVAKENCCKSGLAAELARTPEQVEAGAIVTIFDFDNSASETIRHNFPDDPSIEIRTLFDETDDSIFNEDMSVNWLGLIDKTQTFLNIYARKVAENPEAHAALIMDGCSTFLKWCEFAMTDYLINRTKHPIDIENGDNFNQKEWRTRNKLFRDTLTRADGPPIQKVFFTFHLKDHKVFQDIGSGQKGLIKIGEKPEWVEGTQRIMSQQIFLGRYQKTGDDAAGVYADPSLAPGEFVVKARIEEMKGRGMDLVGQERVVLRIKDGKVEWNGIPELRW